jgi:hypothetical protein
MVKTSKAPKFIYSRKPKKRLVKEGNEIEDAIPNSQQFLTLPF